MAWSQVRIVMLLAFLHIGSTQDCIPPPKGMDVTEQAFRSAIVVKAKVTVPGKSNHTAVVTDLFKTRNGGLKKSAEIKFGPVGKSKGCPRIKKNAQYILLLENESPTDEGFYRIKYNPIAKLKLMKKLKKVLCPGCVKPPKFIKPKKDTTAKENQEFTFNCKVSGYPKPIAQFIKDGVILPKAVKGMKISVKKRGGGGKIKIKKLKPEHAGTYTCKATNLGGTANSTFYLKVLKDDCTPCAPEKANYCVNGRCCSLPGVSDFSCRCEVRYQGKRCNEKVVPLPREKITELEARYHQQTIAIMGVCIALLLVIFICYVVYCKFKKSRSYIRKEIIARNGHVSSRTETPAAITNARLGDGIIGGTEVGNVQMTSYTSTSLNEPGQAHALAFAQRPQTYDDVILPGTASAVERQSLLTQQAELGSRSKYEEESLGDVNQHRNGTESHLERAESNSKRQRLGGIAIGPVPPDGSRNGVGTPMSRRVDQLKPGAQSMSSSTSSIGSHDLKKPVLPIDDRLAHIAKSGVRLPPAYQHGEQDETDGDVVDSAENAMSESAKSIQTVQAQISNQSVKKFNHSSNNNFPTRERVPSSISSGSAAGSTHRVTTFDTDGKIQEEMLERGEGALQGVTPHSPTLSLQSSHARSPQSEVHVPFLSKSHTISSPGNDIVDGSSITSPEFPFQEKSPSGNVYPYYERDQEHISSPTSSHHDNDDLFTGSSPGHYTSAGQRHNYNQFKPPGSPEHVQTSPQMGMGVPYRHGPVAGSMARHHYLPLLTKEKTEKLPSSPDSKLLAGSTVSLSSTSNTSSLESSRHRDSHKIEV